MTVLLETSIKSYFHYLKTMKRAGKTPLSSEEYRALIEPYKQIRDTINAQINALPPLGEKPI